MKRIVSNPAVHKCLEYVNDDKKTGFMNLMETLDVKISEPEYKTYFDDDKEARNVYKVTLKRNGNQATITFGQSIADTYENKDPDLYSILATVGSELSLPDDNFEEFCSELGYDQDSRKAEKQFKQLQKQNKRLSKVISKEEAWSLPS